MMDKLYVPYVTERWVVIPHTSIKINGSESVAGMKDSGGQNNG
jgi:hypothetical protein